MKILSILNNRKLLENLNVIINRPLFLSLIFSAISAIVLFFAINSFDLPNFVLRFITNNSTTLIMALIFLLLILPLGFFSVIYFVSTKMNTELYSKINKGLAQVKKTQEVAVLGFTDIAEARDPDTGNHNLRIGHYSKILATELAKRPLYSKYISNRYIEELFISAPLHDIGKVGIKDSILLKEGKLSDQEFEIMKMHTIIGGNVVADLERKLDFRSFFSLGKEIAYHHHQKYNGTGYPNIFKEDIMLVEKGLGTPLSGENIPLSARIVAVVDVYDALISKRCYKRAMTFQDAEDIIIAEKGEHFDPDIVDCFIANRDVFRKIFKKWKK